MNPAENDDTAVSRGTGNVDNVPYVLAQINDSDEDDVLPLHVASQKGNIDTVRSLLDNGAHIETRDINGCTPLWIAASEGHSEIIEMLIARGADVDAISYNRYFPYHAAIVNGHTEAAVMLLSHNGDAKRADIYHHSLLVFMTEVFKGHEQEILSLVRNFRANGTQGVVDEIRKLESSFIRLMSPLISAGDSWSASPSESSNQRANQAVFNSLTSAFNWCDLADASIKALDAMFDRTFNNVSLIDASTHSGFAIGFIAMLTHFIDIIVALHRCNSNAVLPNDRRPIDFRCNTALHLTTTLEAMKLILDNEAGVEGIDAENIDGWRPIHSAARTGVPELVDLLIQHGANVDSADIFGNTPLHEAVCHGLDVVKLLVQHGAKVNLQNIDGKTPLHIAVERQQSEVIMFLLSQGADVGLTDVWRNTPLHYVTSKPELFRVKGFAEYCAKLFIKKQHNNKSFRNAVGVSVLKHIAIHIGLMPVITSVVHCRQEHELLAVDSHGNTPLHHAVGVYHKQKMFKMSFDAGTAVDFLVKHGADIHAQNKSGLTPLHVARGIKAVKACLLHADDRSFTIEDNQGRNFFHLLFLLRTEDEVEMDSDVWLTIPASSGEFKADHLDRTPLHYACMCRGGRNKCSDFTRCFVNRFSLEQINKQDTLGRTALHYAAIVHNHNLVNLLQETKKADNTIQDNFGKTAKEYMTLLHAFDAKVSSLRLTSSSSCIARNHRSMLTCVAQYLANRSEDLALCTEELRKLIRDVRGCDSTSYVRDVYRRCQFDYADDLHRRPLSPNEEGSWRKNEDQMISEESRSKVQSTFVAIQNHVKKAMEHLAKEISTQDDRFKCEAFPVGSAHEETKIGCCDEFDYNFVLVNLSTLCKVGYSPESPPGFVLLKASTPEYDEDLFNNNGTLNTSVVKFQFDVLVKQVLSSSQFCKETGLEFLDQFQAEFSPGGNVSTKLNTCVTLTFTQRVNRCHILHGVSIDVVPAIQIDWWPDGARRQDLCQTGECLIVFTQPQNKYPWIGWTEPHGFISFARTESRLLRDCPQVVKAAYMVVKRMSKYFCHYRFFPSYVIKTALLWCLNEDGFSTSSHSCHSNEVNWDELLRLVQKLLRRLLCFAAQGYVPSYFMPKCHQPVWLQERYLKQFHMRLFQNGLTYEDLLFSLNEKHVHDQLLEDIKSIFVFSHVMYWSMLTDTDELELFVPSVSPLSENRYDPDAIPPRN